MSRQKEAGGIEFPLEPLGKWPGLRFDMRQGIDLIAAEQSRLPGQPLLLAAMGKPEHGFDASEDARAVRFENVESASRNEALQHAFVDIARTDAQGEIAEIAERCLAARSNDPFGLGYRRRL